MKYEGRALGSDLTLAIEDEGIKIGSRYLDYSEVWSISPVSHRVLIDTMSGEQIEISMLGYSFDGFWEELLDRFGKRSLEALFVDEELIMLVEGEYQLPAESGDQMRVATESLSGGEQRRLSGERGRARIALYSDSVCILPQTCGAVRIPLCFAREIKLYGYVLTITMFSGAEYTVKIVDSNGNPVSTSSQEKKVIIEVKSDFFTKIISFISRLFGSDTITL